MRSGRASIALGAALLAVLASGAQAQPRTRPQPSAKVLDQIHALRAEKRSRSTAQRKLGSHLLYAARLRRGEAAAPGVPSLRSRLTLDAAGRAHVGIRAQVTPRLLARIAAAGGAVTHTVPGHAYVDAHVPLEALEALAALPEVRSLRPALPPFTRTLDASEGDVAHRADLLRQSFGADGSGVTIGVLSDGVDALASLQASGDLPAVQVLPFQAGSGSEGTAMLEILHDLAPGASLLFATAFSSQAQFAANVLALRDAGADVIVDDVGYFAEAVFQDDDVAQAVASVVADGRPLLLGRRQRRQPR
jgi:hypothetical protein